MDLLDDLVREDRASHLTEIIQYMHYMVEPQYLMRILSRDNRFMKLGNNKEPDTLQYVPKKALFRALVGLNRTARITQTTHIRIDTLVSWISHVFASSPSRKDLEKVLSWARDNILAAPISPEEAIFIASDLVIWVQSKLLCSIWDLFENISIRNPSRSFLENEVERHIFDFLDELWPAIKTRNLDIVMMRLGIKDGCSHTLEEVGDEYGITRERVRQIEQRFWKQVNSKRKKREILLRAFVALLLKQRGRRLFSKADGKDFFRLQFISEVCDLPFCKMEKIGVFALGIDQQKCQLILDILKSPESCIFEYALTFIDGIGELYLCPEDREWLALALSNKKRKSMNWPQIVFLALQEIGRPAHYVEISEQCKLLFPERDVTPHNILAAISRDHQEQLEDSPLVWTGTRGVYALREWGYERPTKGLHETVFEIVKDKHEETSRAVSLTTIMAEIGKYRKIVNESSVSIAAFCNPKLELVGKNSFIPATGKKLDKDDESGDSEELDKVLRGMDHLTK